MKPANDPLLNYSTILRARRLKNTPNLRRSKVYPYARRLAMLWCRAKAYCHGPLVIKIMTKAAGYGTQRLARADK